MRLHEEDRRFQMHFPSHWPGSTAYSSTFFCFVLFSDGILLYSQGWPQIQGPLLLPPGVLGLQVGHHTPTHISSQKRARRPQPASHPWTRPHALSLGWPLAQAVPTDKCSKCLNNDSCSQASVAD